MCPSLAEACGGGPRRWPPGRTAGANLAALEPCCTSDRALSHQHGDRMARAHLHRLSRVLWATNNHRQNCARHLCASRKPGPSPTRRNPLRVVIRSPDLRHVRTPVRLDLHALCDYAFYCAVALIANIHWSTAYAIVSTIRSHLLISILDSVNSPSATRVFSKGNSVSFRVQQYSLLNYLLRYSTINFDCSGFLRTAVHSSTTSGA